MRADKMLKALKHARLDNSYEAELRKVLAVDLVILDDFAIDVLDPTESRDHYGGEAAASRERTKRVPNILKERVHEILPKLATPAGFEIGSAMSINPVAPEDAAEALRRIHAADA